MFFPVFQYIIYMVDKNYSSFTKLGENKGIYQPDEKREGSDEREKKGQQPKTKLVGKVYKTLKNDRL